VTDAQIQDRLRSYFRDSPEEDEFGPPCRDADLRVVPPPLRWFYKRADGASLFGGDLLLFPAAGVDDGTIERASELARQADWHVPKEVTLFAKEAGDEVVGVWTPQSKFPSPIVLTGLVFKPAAHVLLATSFERYLMTRIVWEYAGTEFAADAFDLFKVPKELRIDDLESLDGEAWFQWADPALPAPPADPYRDPLTAEELRRILV